VVANIGAVQLHETVQALFWLLGLVRHH